MTAPFQRIMNSRAERTRLFVYNGGFLTQKRLRRILDLSGYDLRLGLPGKGDMVGVWGNSPTAHRGLNIAAKRQTPVLRVEDAFLRSLNPGRAGQPPIGLHLDQNGVHFSPSTPCDLEHLLTNNPLDDTAILDRARDSIARMKELHLSKYSAFDPSLAPPDPGYVLVVDQTQGDASVTASGADAARFREMLVIAQEEHPGARIIIKTHPETRAGYRQGYYSEADQAPHISLCDDAISPWHLLDGAIAVYTVSSQLGFEAILAGHKPRIFGQPFYAGWGLTQDEMPLPQRKRNLTAAQLFAAAMILYPTWYDPFKDELCQLERVLDILESQTKAWRQDHQGWHGQNIRLWKRKHFQKIFGSFQKMRFGDSAAHPPRRTLIWAAQAGDDFTGTRVEDGFLRSRGLGAQLVPPLSLVLDDLGIYYDPSQPSQLDQLIAKRATLRSDQTRRAEKLITSLTQSNLSKYNLGGAVPPLPNGHKILVPGQVEDDASILRGAGEVRTNADLLRRVRADNPDAVIIYKPHPDVEAGLRTGAIDATDLADVVAYNADPIALLNAVDEIWTMTSLLGFEALLRGISVTTLGTPFYAGWGLTDDKTQVPAWRDARPSLAGLVHATLIDYPRYFDPKTNQICPVEVVVDRLKNGDIPHPGPMNRALAKLQGVFATYAHLWR